MLCFCFLVINKDRCPRKDVMHHDHTFARKYTYHYKKKTATHKGALFFLRASLSASHTGVPNNCSYKKRYARIRALCHKKKKYHQNFLQISFESVADSVVNDALLFTYKCF